MTAVPAPTATTTVLNALALLGTGIACGAAPPPSSPGDDPVVRPIPAAQLTISVRQRDPAGSGREEAVDATLTCAPGADRVTGYLRLERAVDLCRRLRELTGDLTSPPPRDRVCAQVYGGPATARISGRLDGRRVDRRLARSDGCQIADWDRLGALLPDVE